MRPALIVVAALAAATGCPRTPSTEAEQLLVEGTLERDGISGDAMTDVAVDYDSAQGRGEWWPCDLRLTAAACVGDHHMNVYVSLPQATSLDDVGTAGCVDAEGTPFGVYELLHAEQSQTIGTDVAVFVLVASDVTGDPGALLDDDDETTAASRLTSGTLAVERLAGDGSMSITIDGRTSGDRPVRVAFGGPVSEPAVVPPLEEPATCVDAADQTK